MEAFLRMPVWELLCLFLVALADVGLFLFMLLLLYREYSREK